MIAIISNSYEVSKKIIEKLHTEHNQTFCAIEADYGENVINTDCIGVDSFYSHHTLDENYSQPCLAFQEENRDKRNKNKSLDTENSAIEVNVRRKSKLTKIWNQVVNIGSVYNLTLANLQYHTIYLTETLGFSYVRIWNVFR